LTRWSGGDSHDRAVVQCQAVGGAGTECLFEAGVERVAGVCEREDFEHQLADLGGDLPVGILGLLLEHTVRVALAKPLAASIFLVFNGFIRDLTDKILAEAARLLERNRDGLKNTFADTRTLTTSLTDYRRELEETLDVAPLTVDNIYNIIDENAGSARVHLVIDKMLMNGQMGKEICNLMGLKQLGCATGTLKDYGPDFGLGAMLDLMGNGVSGNP